MSFKSWLVTLVWISAIVLVGWVLSQLPLGDIVQVVDTLSWPQWLAFSGCNLAIILLFTWRWRLLAAMFSVPVSFGRLLMIRQAGQAISFITPGPQFGGEPLQVFWLWQRGRVSLHKALLAVGLDRFYELWINTGVLLLSVLLLWLSNTITLVYWREAIAGLGALLGLLSLAGWIIARHPQWLFNQLQRLANHWRHHPRLQNIDSHGQRLGAELKHIFVAHKTGLLSAFLVSLLGWGMLLVELWLLLGFFDLQLPASNFLFIFVAMRVAFLVPLPGGIGSLEAAMFWAFHSLGLPATAAIGVIALMRLRDTVVLLLGLLCVKVLSSVDVDKASVGQTASG